MKPCFGYIRVSTQKQGEGVSLDEQKDAIMGFASHNDLSIIRWFEEKETAAKSGRPVFNQMLKLLKRGKASGLVMHKIDRSARNLRDWAVIGELSDAGIDVHFATESLDFRSRGGRLTADIQAVIAADYIRNLREECIKGLNGRLKQGLYPFRAPIGYLDNGRGKPKTPDPAKAPMVKAAFRLYASGEHSIRSLQGELKRLGLRNHTGQPLSKHGVETLLANPFYTGVIEIKRTGVIYPGVHEPLISATTFARVQDVKSGRSGKKVTRHNHLYRGLFRCGLCVGPMSPERQKGRVYYRCQRPGCPTKTIREDKLDAVVVNHLKALELSDADASKLRKKWLGWIEEDDAQTEAKALDLRIDKAKARLDRLTDLLIDGTISKDDHNRRKRSLTLELAAIEEESKKATQNHLSLQEMGKFLELMKSLAGLHKTATAAEKRHMVRNAFSNRQVAGESVELEPYDWLQVKETALAVPVGEPYRPTSRTLELLETITEGDEDDDFDAETRPRLL